MSRFVISSAELCKACGACEEACREAHSAIGMQAYPRLHTTKTAKGTMHIHCRHCEDAPCAEVCPVAAITHGEGTVDLNEGTCIGCKMCALACPFGAIEIHGSSTDSQQLADHSGGQVSLNSLLAWAVGVRSVAVKCDLCHDRAEGPRCVEVCPTQALRLVDDESLAEVLQRTAELTSRM